LPALTASLKETLHSLDGLIRLWRRLARDAAEHAGNEAVAFLTPSVSWVPTTIFTALPSMIGFLFFFRRASSL
jgi:hypothetical protein